MIRISPSVLAGDFAQLGSEAKRMEDCGADMLHLDVMDGMFVPNLTFGAPVINALRRYSDILFDVHLMIEEPLRYIRDFAAAGADIITVHTEACADIEKTIAAISDNGCIPALSIKPATPVETVFPYLDSICMVLVMTVEPGFGGQKFMPEMLEKITALRRECIKQRYYTNIQVDGGITEETVALAAAAGANVFVAGSAVFGSPEPDRVIESLRETADRAYSGSRLFAV